MLFRSLNRGDAWQEISPDLTTGDATKCGLNSGYVPYCTITSISESPLTAGVIWIGTDDGKVQVTRDHGATWTDVTPAVAAAGGPADRYVSRVFASPHDAGTAFVAKSGFRNDDFRPFLYRTTDFGKTWTCDLGQPRRFADQRRRAGSQEPEPADRGERPRRVGIDRCRRRAGRV